MIFTQDQRGTQYMHACLQKFLLIIILCCKRIWFERVEGQTIISAYVIYIIHTLILEL